MIGKWAWDFIPSRAEPTGRTTRYARDTSRPEKPRWTPLVSQAQAISVCHHRERRVCSSYTMVYRTKLRQNPEDSDATTGIIGSSQAGVSE